MKEMLAILALKVGIRAAYWIAGKIRRRFVTEKIHAEVDKAQALAREENNGARHYYPPCNDG